MNVFDNIMKFAPIILTGILVMHTKNDGTIKKYLIQSGFFIGYLIFKPFVSFVTGIDFEDRESENKKLIDEAENLKKQLKPLDE